MDDAAELTTWVASRSAAGWELISKGIKLADFAATLHRLTSDPPAGTDVPEAEVEPSMESWDDPELDNYEDELTGHAAPAPPHGLDDEEPAEDPPASDAASEDLGKRAGPKTRSGERWSWLGLRAFGTLAGSLLPVVLVALGIVLGRRLGAATSISQVVTFSASGLRAPPKVCARDPPAVEAH